MRSAMLPLFLTVMFTACTSDSSKNTCENAGGSCHASMPDACISSVVGHTGGYSCGGSAVCCLPISFTACEEGGGKCVAVGACPSGNIGNPAKYSCGSGVSLACCLPVADRGRAN